MYDISKFKLAFPLCKEQKVISKFLILAEKFHFKQLNFFKAHPVCKALITEERFIDLIAIIIDRFNHGNCIIMIMSLHMY